MPFLAIYFDLGSNNEHPWCLGAGARVSDFSFNDPDSLEGVRLVSVECTTIWTGHGLIQLGHQHSKGCCVLLGTARGDT